MVETLDLFPTLCDLASLPQPDFADGISLRPILENPSSAGHPAISYKPGANTIRTDTHRLILHKDGYAELYDHTSPKQETNNLAESNQQLVRQLSQRLKERLQR